jgi:hypothetical protein
MLVIFITITDSRIAIDDLRCVQCSDRHEAENFLLYLLTSRFVARNAKIKKLSSYLIVMRLFRRPKTVPTTITLSRKLPVTQEKLLRISDLNRLESAETPVASGDCG